VSYLVLACSGLDKAEGSVSREVALVLAEEAGADIVCPVALARTPARYKRALAEKRLVVVDGCATRCAAKLAAAAEADVAHKLIVADVVKASGAALAPDLRLGPDALELARKMSDEIRTRMTAAATQRRVAAVAAPAAPVPAAAAADQPAGEAFTTPSDFVVIVHDKYEFRVPSTGFLFNANDVWVQTAGDRARVGISDYMQQRLTDITYVDLPQVGAAVEQFDEVCTVESTKAAFEVVSPVSGTVTAVNLALEDTPEAINEDPYGSWLVELQLSAWDEDRTLLVEGPAYATEVERKAAEDAENA